jgi:tRNA(Ile)-lysidine synthase
MALHINHGLQAASSQFEEHCRHLCAGLDVPFYVCAVEAHPSRGESPEDAARKARYKAFDDLALLDIALGAIKSIVFAHNADDQVETVLLALSRGSGLGGLSAMPQHWRRSGHSFHRPLLQVSAEDIRIWLRAQAVGWVEDPTNADIRYTRNRIRHTLMPALRQAFPHVLDAASRTARHAAQAQVLLDELAQQDVLALVGAGNMPDGLPLRELRTMASARQANLLRYWLKTQFGVVATAAQLDQLQHQLDACTTRGHHIDMRVGNGFARREGRLLTWRP